MNWIQMRKAAREGRAFTTPAQLDCSHCRICDLGGRED
jgi:hypothetical protein